MEKQSLFKPNAECPWGGTLHWFDSLASTNTKAAQLARQGAVQGTAVVAGHQTQGRGRMGRSFSSPPGMGVYLSVILRPHCPPEELLHLTCAVGVAACNAVEAVCGLRPGLKWPNDLVLGGKKLGGILTELALEKGAVQYAIVGIGINCRQQKEDFPPELQEIAASLAMAGRDISCKALANALVNALRQMNELLLSGRAALMERYRADCITPGQQVLLVQGDTARCAAALGIDDRGGLVVRLPDGSVETITSGEASIRGMYGYT